MNKSAIYLNQIDLSLPVELVPFQYDIEHPSFLVYVTDLESVLLPYCIMMPLVVFRYHFCQWSKEYASPETARLLETLFNNTMHWRKAQADMISINFYITD